MNHEESKLQQACVSWFRGAYPQYAMLLTHPINEGSGHSQIDRRRQGIHKAEGAVAGVPDLVFFMSAEYRKPSLSEGLEWVKTYNCLGIEFKTAKGRQSQEQKDFQKMFEAAGYRYVIVRSYEVFQNVMIDYITHIIKWRRTAVADTYIEITKAAKQREKEKFYKVIGKE